MARRSRLGVLSPAYILRRKSISQGFLGGNVVWQVVGGVIFGRRLWRKVMGKEPELVATERLEPGQAMTIRAIDPRSERR